MRSVEFCGWVSISRVSSAGIAELWNVNFDLKGLRGAVLWAFWLNVYEMWGPKIQNVSFCRQIFFCVCFIDFFLREILQFSVVYPTKSLNPILKLFYSGFTVDTPVWLACGITKRRSDLPGDYLKTNQNVLLQGRKWMWGFCSKVYEMRIGLTENIRMWGITRNANSNTSTE